ncbi:MAG: hypothetical protein ACRD2B_03915 [Terriglobia bacterium]
MNQKPQRVLILLALAVVASPAWPQGISGSASQSGSSSNGPVQVVSGTPTPSSASQLQPDTHPLSGAYLFTLGSLFEGRSYFEPVFSLSEVGQTHAENFLPGTTNSLELATMPVADLSVLHVSRSNDLYARYLGGGIIYDNAPSATTSFHMINLGDSVQFRRLSLSFSDMFSYLPNASYGFGGFGLPAGTGIGSFGGLGFSGGFGQINPMFTSSQSILTNEYSAINNTALAQAAYAATARTSVTFAGVYGTLQGGSHRSGFITGNTAYGMAGISHSLTARDAIGVNFTYGTFHYAGRPESFNVKMVEFSYGRKITGRLGLQLYGGPELLTYNIPNLQSQSRVYGTGSAAVNYQRGRNTFSIYGGRYSTGGSGLLAGAETTTISGSWSRRVTRRWSTSLYGGYARNSGIGSVANVGGYHYSYWFGNFVLNHPLSRYVGFYVEYEYEHETSTAGACTTSVCAVTTPRQLFGVGFTFTPRPIGL